MRVDVAVIGAGAAGLSVAYGVARLGGRVALIERGVMGGECLNFGCVPSKAMLAAVRRGLGWKGVRGEIARAVGAIAPADSAERYEELGAVVLRGAARFVGSSELEVEGVRVVARRVVVACGSRPLVPGFLAGVPHLTNETVWGLERLPGRLLVLGGGPMGLEMAEAFAGLGVEVTLVGDVLAREDAALAALLVAALRGRGVRFVAGRAVAAREGVLVMEGGEEVVGDAILVAAGRVVDTDGLNLAAAGIVARPGGIRTDRGLRAEGNRRVFVVGDAADPEGVGAWRFTHVAGAQAGVVVKRAMFRLPARVSATPPVRVVYTAPELAQVGMTLAQAGEGARALTWPFAENDRAIAEGVTVGLVKLVVNRRGRLVGAGIVGPGAGEMIGLYALALAERTKLSVLAGLVLPYPTRSEAGKRAVGAMFAEKIFAAGPRLLVKLMSRLP